MYTSTDHKDQIDFESKQLLIERDKLDFYIHFYQQFGWAIENHYPQNKQSRLIEIKMKRNVQSAEYKQLQLLQYRGEQLLGEIERLESRGHRLPLSLAISLGLIGVTLIIFAIQFLLQSKIFWVIPFGLLGLISCILPLFVYERVLKKQYEKAKPTIDHKHKELLSLYEQAYKIRDVE